MPRSTAVSGNAVDDTHPARPGAALCVATTMPKVPLTKKSTPVVQAITVGVARTD